MSAIFGFCQRGSSDAMRGAMQSMGKALQIFGSDRAGEWSEGDTGIGGQFKRMLPEDDADFQPLIGGGGRYVLVADVRIDDRRALIEKLGLDLRESMHLADSALLLAAWEKWNSDTPDHLYGEFAFVVFDRYERRWFLARDHAGQRPLFFHIGKNIFAFASMPMGLLALPNMNFDVNWQALTENLLLQDVKGEQTFHAEIARVQPGFCGWFSFDKGWQARAWWQDRMYMLPQPSSQNYSEALRERTEMAVQGALRRRGKVASHMSSGFDSSAVTVTAARLLAKEGGMITAYTHVPKVGWDPDNDLPGMRGNEGPLAALAAARYPNIRHICLEDAPCDLVSLSRELLGLAGRPIRNLLNTIWLRNIAQAAAADGTTTLLIGSAGNATISFNGMLLGPSLLWHGHWRRWLAQAFQMPVGSSRVAYLRESIRAGLPAEWVALLRRFFRANVPSHFIDHPVRAELLFDQARQSALGLTLDGMLGSDGWSSIDQLALRNRLLSGPDVGVVRKAWLAQTGVEWRDPLAARDLCEWCFAVPAELYVQGGIKRSLYKKAFSCDLPDELINQVKKGEQAADWVPIIEASRAGIHHVITAAHSDSKWHAILDLERMIEAIGGINNRPLHARNDARGVKQVTLRGLTALLFDQGTRGIF